MKATRKIIMTLAVAVICAPLLATVAQADPIIPTNVRPVAGVPANAQLQGVLDTIYGCANCVNAVTDQNPAGMWAVPGAGFGGTLPILQFQSGAFLNNVTFGIWSGTDTTALTTVQIFSGLAGPGTIASLAWLVPGDPFTLTISGGANVNTGVFGAINRFGFGFYIDSPAIGGTDSKFWSVDQLNAGGVAQMLAYTDAGLPGGANRWTFAWEDLNRFATTGPLFLPADNNFVDLVVHTESLVPLAPVPEPATLALLALGLIGVAGFARRRPL